MERVNRIGINMDMHTNLSSPGAYLVRCLLLLAVFFAIPVTASAVGNAALESMDINPGDGNSVQIAMQFSGPAPTPLSFTIAQPARITLDFPNTRNDLAQRTRQIRIGSVLSLSSAQASDRTRVVISLRKMMTYQTETRGNQLILTLSPQSVKRTLTTAPPAVAPTQPQPVARSPQSVNSRYTPPPTVTDGKTVSSIDFRRGPNGEARITVNMSDPNIPIDIKQQGSRVIVDFKGATLATELQRRMDVLDFATPVKTIDSRTSGGNTEIVIKAHGNFSQIAYQTDKTYTIEIRPVTKKQLSTAIKQISFKGEKLSLNFQDIEVRSVLQLIADFTGLNVVVSDDVTGNLTLRLKNVPWDQALDIIMKTKGLAKRQHGNVLYVDTAINIRNREEAALKSTKTIENLAPLRTEIIPLNYADAQEMADLLKSSGKDSILSQNGSISLDRRTNSLLIKETVVKLEEIRSLIKTLDVPVRQVLIESRIVTASDKFTHELGVTFGASDRSQPGNSTLNSNFNISLPAASAAGTLGIALAKIPLTGTNLDLELSAAEVEDRAEIVANPRIITSNKTTARIEQGVEIPYEEATSSGATNISFKKAVLSLEVTPHITRDDRINMQLSVTRDSVGAIFNNIPSIDTREVETEVLVENGQTIVLGGIFEETKAKNSKRVPFFADLPILGHLFRRDSKRSDKSELLIFVTPKIIDDSLSLH